jgi:hypothetical protein
MSQQQERSGANAQDTSSTTPSRAGEPPVEALSDEALESVAGGCQIGDSKSGDGFEPLNPLKPWTPILIEPTFG